MCAVLSKCLTHQGLDRTISILFPFVPSHTHTCTHSFAPALSLFISDAICYKGLAEHQRRLAPTRTPCIHPNCIQMTCCGGNIVSTMFRRLRSRSSEGNKCQNITPEGEGEEEEKTITEKMKTEMKLDKKKMRKTRVQKHDDE